MEIQRSEKEIICGRWGNMGMQWEVVLTNYNVSGDTINVDD